MIYLARVGYPLVIPLFEPYTHLRAAIWAVFEGRQAGGVYTDGATPPRVAAVWSQDCYLAGEPTDGLFLRETLALVRKTRMRRRYVYVFAHDVRWLDLAEPLLAGDGARRVWRSVFRFDPGLWQSRHRGWRERIPAGYAVVPLDATLADYPGIHTLWGSVEHFLAAGFGYAVLQGPVRVTKAQTVFIGDGRAEIGIDTLPEHRRRGLARAAACACIEHALRQGLTPEWGAYDNPPSVALAHDLGFLSLPDWPCLYLPGLSGA